MPVSARAQAVPLTVEFSLTHGGPFYELMRKLGLVRGDAYDVLRQSLALICVAWLPLELLPFMGHAAAAPSFSFWKVLSIHIRFLIALPLLFVAEQVMERRCRAAIESFSDGDFVRGTPSVVARITHWAERLRSSFVAELGLLVMVAAARIVVWRYSGHVSLVHDYADSEAPPLALPWYSLVSLPLFNFLLLRLLWRWLIWTQLLWRLSRLNLRLVPTHPDRAGGIALLAEPTYAMACLLAGLSCVFAASWGSAVFYGHVDPATFAVEIAIMLVLGELLALGPYLPFAGKLLRTRFEGEHRYTGFALSYTRMFERHWIDSRDRNGLLGTPDIQSLNDLISSYQSLHAMRIFPFARDQVLIVLVAMVAPLLPLPLLASKQSMDDVLRRLLEVLLMGG